MYSNIKHSATGLALAGSLAMNIGCVAAEKTEVVEKKKPNFLFIIIDDLGWKDLGCYGSTFYETPNLDKLCTESMKFTDAYASCPVCSPTRASVLAGKYPARMRITNFLGGSQPEQAKKKKWMLKRPLLPPHWVEKMKLSEVTIAETLKSNGYSTFFAGKWHIGFRQNLWPEHQGFDVNMGGCNKGGPYGGGGYFSPYANPRLKDGPKGEHLPDRLATETIKFMDKNKEKPFLAYLSFYSVHTPLMSRKDLENKYQAKKEKGNLKDVWGKEGKSKIRQSQTDPIYAGMVEAMDMAIGRVLDSLKKSGLDKNTIVIFFSDNGGLATVNGRPTSNLPLRGGKGWMYEGGIREPMMIKWPGVTKPGSVCNTPVTSTDFYPTMLNMANLPLIPEQHMDGKSLVPLLEGEKMDRGPIYWHYPHYGHQGGTPSAAVRDGDWKLIEFFENNNVELYNLKDDIGEKNNLAEKMPEKAEQLRSMLHNWQKEVKAQMPTKNRRYRRKKKK